MKKLWTMKQSRTSLALEEHPSEEKLQQCFITCLKLDYFWTANQLVVNYVQEKELLREYKSLEAVQDKQLKPVEASRVKEQHDKNEAQKRKLREYEEMVHVSFQLLSDKVQYKNYLKMIKVRSYLIQPLDIDDLKQIIGSKMVFPFQIFEMRLVRDNRKQLVTIKVDIPKGTVCIIPQIMDKNLSVRNKIITEKTKLFFQQIKGVCIGYDENEVYLNLVENHYDDFRSLHFQCIYLHQARYFQEVVLLGLQRSNKALFSNKQVELNYIYTMEQQLPQPILQSSMFKLVKDDQIMPPKSIQMLNISYMGEISGFLLQGYRQILIYEDKYLQNLLKVIPFSNKILLVQSKANQVIIEYLLCKQQNISDPIIINFDNETITKYFLQDLKRTQELPANNLIHKFEIQEQEHVVQSYQAQKLYYKQQLLLNQQIKQTTMTLQELEHDKKVQQAYKENTRKYK